MQNHIVLPNNRRMPAVGLWWTACCVLDIQQIRSDDDLAEAMNGWKFGGYAGAWSSREEAITALNHTKA